MTKKTTTPPNGSILSTTNDRPRLRRRTLRVLTSADLDQVNGGVIRTGDANPLTRQPDCPTN